MKKIIFGILATNLSASAAVAAIPGHEVVLFVMNIRLVDASVDYEGEVLHFSAPSKWRKNNVNDVFVYTPPEDLGGTMSIFVGADNAVRSFEDLSEKIESVASDFLNIEKTAFKNNRGLAGEKIVCDLLLSGHKPGKLLAFVFEKHGKTFFFFSLSEARLYYPHEELLLQIVHSLH